MLIWLVFACLTALVVWALLRPLALARAVAESGRPDLAVYKDQLAEIDRDRARGILPEAEAEAARIEVSRRLLRAARASQDETTGNPSDRIAAAVAAIAGIPAVSLGLYLALGSPDVPDQPLAPRLAAAPESQSLETMIARVEAHLARSPEDGRGWEVLAPVYVRLGRAADAIAAWRQAIRILGSSATRESGLGEALTAASGGVVTAEAQDAFRRAVAADPKAVLPRMYLALAAEQDGRPLDAAAAWRALLADARGDEPWAAEARAQLARLDPESAGRETFPNPGSERPATEGGPAAGPDQAIEAMVARLGDRLQKQGGTVEEWLRLIRSYSVLGRGEAARAAALKAREAFKDDVSAMARIEEGLRGLGLSL